MALKHSTFFISIALVAFIAALYAPPPKLTTILLAFISGLSLGGAIWLKR